MALSDRERWCLDALAYLYPNPHCALTAQSPFELLVSIMLSAQATDRQVNKVTEKLFATASTPKALAAMPLLTLEKWLQPLGLFRTKAHRLHALCHCLLQNPSASIPTSLEGLLTLPGIGRKTASVFLNLAEGLPLIGVDTHVMRVSQRLGLTVHSKPDRIEKELMHKLPDRDRIYFNLRCVTHGRALCRARAPRCPACFLNRHCLYACSALSSEQTSEISK